MKTYSIFLIIGLFMGQLSFGTGNETCCPDTPSAELVASMQMQLDQIQTESQKVAAQLPSLEQTVKQKLSRQPSLLDQLQVESEGANVVLPQSHTKQLQLKLNSRIQIEDKTLGGERVQF